MLGSSLNLRTLLLHLLRYHLSIRSLLPLLRISLRPLAWLALLLSCVAAEHSAEILVMLLEFLGSGTARTLHIMVITQAVDIIARVGF